jgi:hypothetical protein
VIIRTRKIQFPALPSQQRFFACAARVKGFSGPVGSGKTYALNYQALMCAMQNPGRVGLIGAPTYPMLKDVTLRTMLEILEEKRIRFTYRKDDHVLTLLHNKAIILFRSLDRPETLRGSTLAWIGVDELTYCRDSDAWLRLEARLRDPKATNHQMFAVWTPKGYDWVYKRFISPKEKLAGHHAILAEAAENSFVLSKRPDYYDQLKTSYDEKFYNQEALGMYLNVHSDRVYYAYSEANEDPKLRYVPDAGLHWSLDFNVDPMVAVIAQHLNGRVHVLEEIFLRNANTDEMCDQFERCAAPYLQAYRAANGGAPLPVNVNGDSTGQSRSTASKTDYELITEFFRSRGQFKIRMDYPTKNPPVKDRVNSVNALLRNANGKIRAYVHPACKELITDFYQVSWKAGALNFELDKVSDKKRTHLSDAFGYMVWQVAPINAFVREIIPY